MRTQTTDINIHMLGVLLIAEVNPSEAKIFLYDESNTPIGMQPPHDMYAVTTWEGDRRNEMQCKKHC